MTTALIAVGASLATLLIGGLALLFTRRRPTVSEERLALAVSDVNMRLETMVEELTAALERAEEDNRAEPCAGRARGLDRSRRGALADAPGGSDDPVRRRCADHRPGPRRKAAGGDGRALARGSATPGGARPPGRPTRPVDHDRLPVRRPGAPAERKPHPRRPRGSAPGRDRRGGIAGRVLAIRGARLRRRATSAASRSWPFAPGRRSTTRGGSARPGSWPTSTRSRTSTIAATSTRRSRARSHAGTATTATWRSSSSISTTSRRSTTASAISPATPSSRRPPSASARSSARRTSRVAWAATSSRSSSPSHA